MTGDAKAVRPPIPDAGNFPEIWVGLDDEGAWQAVIDVPPFGSPPMQIGSGYVQLGTGEDIGDPREMPGWVLVTPKEPEDGQLKRARGLLIDEGGQLVVSYDESLGDGSQPWTVSLVVGREAPDSDMAGGAAYGIGAVLPVAMEQALTTFRR